MFLERILKLLMKMVTAMGWFSTVVHREYILFSVAVAMMTETLPFIQ